MTDINTWTGTGHLTRDAELKTTNGGMAVCSFSIASNYKKKNGDKWDEAASFFDCTLFGKYGETMAQYLTKGKPVAVTGELRQERWEKDGQSRSRVVVIVSELKLFGSGQGAPGSSAAPTEASAKNFKEDDEIPFN